MPGRTPRKDLYERLVRQHAAGLYRFALRLCGREDAAEDLLQETYCQAWRSIGALRRPECGRAWLFQVLRHRYAHWAREGRRRPLEQASMVGAGEFPQVLRPDQIRILDERESLQIALDAVDDRFRVPFLLVFLEGQSCRETAKTLGIPLGTVLSRIYRCRQALREELRRTCGWDALPLPAPGAGRMVVGGEG